MSKKHLRNMHLDYLKIDIPFYRNEIFLFIKEEFLVFRGKYEPTKRNKIRKQNETGGILSCLKTLVARN
jgi:hypothetical protein